MRKKILGFLIFCLYRFFSLTWRFKVHEPLSLKHDLLKKSVVIFAHWHGDELVLIRFVPLYRVGTVVSKSQDGDLMAEVFKWIGGRSSRGSSSRGSVGGLKGLIRIIRDGWNCSFAVDGPRGPIYKVKPGVFEVSKLFQVPIYAAGVYCESRIDFPRSWNKTYLPKLFSKVAVYWHGPIGPVDKCQDPRSEALALELEQTLQEAKSKAKELYYSTIS